MRQQKRRSRAPRKGFKDKTQIVVDTHNVKVKDKIKQYEALVEEAVGSTIEHDDQDSNKPCSIVVSEAEDAMQSTLNNRNSILSNSSVDSEQSENIEDRNIQLGSSVFYVVWD